MKPYERKTIIAATVLAAPLFIVYAIFHFGSHVPFWDQWELVPLLQKLHNHNLDIADLWAQHNEHRIIIPQAAMLLMAHLTGWNIYCELIVNFILAAAILAFLYSLLRSTLGTPLPVWLIAVFSVVVFSPVQWENWIWGWQIQIFMNVLAVVVAVWALARWPGTLKGLLIAIAATVVASYSFSNGLFAWVVIGLLLVTQTPRRWGHLSLWVAAAALTIGSFLWGYVKPSHHPPLSVCLHYPLRFLQYILFYIGAPLGAGSRDLIITSGIILIITGVVTCFLVLRHDRKNLAALLPWLALAGYVFVSAAVTGVGRLGFGPSQAVSSRYTTFSMLFVLAVVTCYAKWLEIKWKNRKRNAPALVGLTVFLLVLLGIASFRDYRYGIACMTNRKQQLDVCWSRLKDFPDTPDQYLILVYPHADIVRPRVQTLRELGIILPPLQETSQPDK